MVHAAEHFEDGGRIADAFAEAADLVERRGVSDEAVARDAPVGGLESHAAAKRGGLADGTAGIGAERGEAFICHYGRSAEPPEEPPGMREVSQGLRVTWKAEFSVELPMANSSMFSRPKMTAPAACSFSTTHGVVGGNEFAEDLRAAVEGLAFDGDDIFDGNAARRAGGAGHGCRRQPGPCPRRRPGPARLRRRN